MVDETLEAFGLTREEMEAANQTAADNMLPVPYDIPGEEGPVRDDSFGAVARDAASSAWESARESFEARGTEEGVAGAIPKLDNEVLDQFRLGLGYAADMGLAGLEASDAAWRYSVGLLSEGLKPLGASQNTREQFTRDVSSIPDAFMGSPTALVNPRLPDRPQVTPSQPSTFNSYLFGSVEDFGPTSVKQGDALKSELDYMIGPDTILTPEEGYQSLLRDLDDTLLRYPEGTITFERTQRQKKLLEDLGSERLIELAAQKPHWQDSKYGPFLEETLRPLAEAEGFKYDDLLQAVLDVDTFMPQKRNPLLDSMTEVVLPDAAPIGPRASPDSPARPSDVKAEDLGFSDTVYHTSNSPEQFTSFDLGSGAGTVRSAQDLIGVHVGTARAAAERNFDLTNMGKNPRGFTMELRARTDKPLTKKDVENTFGSNTFDPESSGEDNFSEKDIGDLVSFYEDLIFPESLGRLPEDSREQAAALLRKDLAEQGYTHVPYINDVEDPGSTSLIMLIDRPEGSPAVLRDVRAEFNPDKITDPDLRFAEGGMVLEDQMKIFAEGGIADDGMNRDPISGNEVPPGSLAKEVRDDVDAKLSEGEYVVPADVVRYFGVNYFEKLRQKAKAGLEEMDKDGRIGGEPVPIDEEMPLFDEEEFMLEEQGALGMAEGGFVTPENVGTMFRPGFSFTTPDQGTAPSAATELKVFVNAAGEIRSILFINGQPSEEIPAGFVEDTPENRASLEAQNVVSEGPSDKGSRDRDQSAGIQTPEVTTEGFKGFGKLSEEDSALLNDNPLQFGLDSLSEDPFFTSGRSATLGGAVAGLPGLALGAFAGGYNEVQNIARARAALKVAGDRGLQDSSEYAALERDLKKAEKDANLLVRGLDKLLSPEDKMVASASGASPTAVVAPTTPSAATGGSSGGGSSSSGNSQGSKMGARMVAGGAQAIAPPPPKKTTTAAAAQKPAPSNTSSAAQSRIDAGGTGYSSGSGQGSRMGEKTVSGGGKTLESAKGGLVQRPNKSKKPVAKK